MRRPPLTAVRLLCGCQALLSFGLGLSFPFFAIYLNRTRGVPMSWVGGWLSLAVLATALGQGMGGELSDVLGRKRVMLFSLWCRAATVLGLAAAIRFEWPLPAMLSLHLVSSFIAHFFEPAARGWIADHAPSTERHVAYGWLRTATHGGFAAGPALGGLLAERSYALVFGASALVCAACALWARALLKDDAPPGAPAEFELHGALEAARDPRFARLCGVNALISAAMAQLVVPMSVYATRFLSLRDSQVGLLLSLNGGLILLFQVPATHWLEGVPLTTALVAGSLAYAAGYLGVGLSRGFGGMALSVLVITIGEVLVPPAAQALAANMSPPRARGRYLGFLGLSRQAGAAVGPMAGCAGLELAAARGWSGHWPGVSAVAVLAAAGFYALRSGLKPAEEGMRSQADHPRDPDELLIGG